MRDDHRAFIAGAALAGNIGETIGGLRHSASTTRVNALKANPPYELPLGSLFLRDSIEVDLVAVVLERLLHRLRLLFVYHGQVLFGVTAEATGSENLTVKFHLILIVSCVVCAGHNNLGVEPRVLRMTRKEKYAEYARHCLELGEQRSLPGERLNLLQMAQGWRRLAEQADEANAILAEGRDLGVISQKAG